MCSGAPETVLSVSTFCSSLCPFDPLKSPPSLEDTSVQLLSDSEDSRKLTVMVGGVSGFGGARVASGSLAFCDKCIRNGMQ